MGQAILSGAVSLFVNAGVWPHRLSDGSHILRTCLLCDEHHQAPKLPAPRQVSISSNHKVLLKIAFFRHGPLWTPCFLRLLVLLLTTLTISSQSVLYGASSAHHGVCCDVHLREEINGLQVRYLLLTSCLYFKTEIRRGTG